MAIATRTNTSLAAPFTQAQLSTALQAAFVSAGFSGTFDNFTSGTDLILVYAFVVDNTKTFGTSYLRIRITNTFVINQQIFSSWNAVTHTGGATPSTEVIFTALSPSTNVSFNAFSSVGEANLLIVTQGANSIPLGIIAPVTRRASWDLNNWNWGFIFISSTMAVLRSTNLNQYTNPDNDIALAGNVRMGTANIQDLQRDVLTGLILLNQSNQGFCGKTSDDFGIASGNGSTRYDTFFKSGTSQQYTLLISGSGMPVVRTA